ncbi:MAG: hypothetical protein ACAH83_19895 [Alphaproteobacteria bacterium]
MFENLKARKALQQLTPSLQALDQQLQAVEKIPDPIDRLVRFFDAVSQWNDRQQEAPLSVGVVLNAFRKANGSGEHAKTIEALETLQIHFNRSGRDEYGINRTKPGEVVTADNVYLGNVYGRWTFTANKWKEAFSRDNATAQEDRQIIEGQAAGFVESHIKPMQKLIGSLSSPQR